MRSHEQKLVSSFKQVPPFPDVQNINEIFRFQVNKCADINRFPRRNYILLHVTYHEISSHTPYYVLPCISSLLLWFRISICHDRNYFENLVPLLYAQTVFKKNLTGSPIKLIRWYVLLNASYYNNFSIFINVFDFFLITLWQITGNVNYML